jgi:glycosyltransferase involved in cell wall biosynthesis
VSAQEIGGENVVRTGYVSDAELRSLYEHALCFVFPSRYEGFGIPPLEAMALGCPVVASSIEPVREVCGDAARYFDPHDAPALARILTRLGSEAAADERRRMAERGRRRAESFSWKASAARVLQSIVAANENDCA